nr:nitrate reductase cofactor assembly chaperone [uncultured bacterium]
MKLYKLIAALMDYPTEITDEIFKEATAVADESSVATPSDRRNIAKFVKRMSDIPLIRRQTEYSDIFDTSGQLSLYLFEHVYGSSRKRGQAMSDLIETYRDHGVEVASGELPDYLPVFLEFLSMLDSQTEADDYLADVEKIIDKIHHRLKEADSPYSCLVKILMDHASKGKAHPLPPEAGMSFDGRDDYCSGCTLKEEEPADISHV